MSTEEIRLPVEHVSDTAYMVALCRAMESERGDAHFKDPFAAMLAAPKAADLEKKVPFARDGAWMLTVRTCLIDGHIQRLVKGGADTVVNLAAGLDTRPYRLSLPTGLRWIEADFPGITSYKAERLEKAKPICRLERIALDLRNDIARHQLFTYFGRESKEAIVLTEGLLPYLSEEAIQRLATDLSDESSVRWWIMDICPPSFFRWMRSHMQFDSTKGDVTLTFAPENGPRYFEQFGFKVEAFDSFLEAGERLGRLPPESWMKDPEGRSAMAASGIALLHKAE